MTTGLPSVHERVRACSTPRQQLPRAGLFATLGLFAALVPATVGAQAAPAPSEIRVPPMQPASPSAPPTVVTTPPARSVVVQPATQPAAPARTTVVTQPGTTVVTPPPPGAQVAVTPAPSPAAPPPAVMVAPVAPAQVGPRTDAVTAAEAEEKREITKKLTLLDSRLEALDSKRSDGALAAPIALMTSGYATGLAALAVSMGSFIMAQQVKDADADENRKRYDVNGDDRVDGDDEARFRNIARGMGALSAVGIGAGIAGTVLLSKRLQERRRFDPEVRSLQRQRRELRRELNYSANASPYGAGLSLTGRF